ncbi:Vps52 / Sac2 family [Actinidia rufa]|uniref:Vps52 / Sac2 family n=1 Tax=Actinidia rufa TaxID=165716 RepID=A0A7J0FDM4_9ERIC|nr:Vps52 / Sac2 family [Actinidia rufa]
MDAASIKGGKIVDLSKFEKKTWRICLFQILLANGMYNSYGSSVRFNILSFGSQEAGPEGGKIQMHFEELLKNNTTIFVEELLLEHFSDLIKFVKTRSSEDPTSDLERPITVSEVEPLLKDFASTWKAAIELMHNDVITSFSNFLCRMEILRAALTQLLLYYARFSDCIKRIVGGSALNKDLVSISSIMYEIRKYSRTF